MFYRIVGILVLFVSGLEATTLTGTINYPNAAGVNGRLYMSLSQQAALTSCSTSPGGPLQVAPTYKVVIPVTNGAVSGNVYGNDCMLPNGLYYNVQLQDNNGNTLMNDRWIITGSSINVGTIVSAIIDGTTGYIGSTGFVMLAPSTDQKLQQPGSTLFTINNVAVTAKLTLPDGTSCSTSGCLVAGNVVTTNTAQTISGAKTYSTDILGAAQAKVGTQAAPFAEGWFAGQVGTSALRLVQGPTSAPTDFFAIEFNGANLHEVQLVDSSDVALFHFLGGGGYPTAHWDWLGSIRPTTDAQYDLGFDDGATTQLYWNNIFAVFMWIRGNLNFGPSANLFIRTITGGDADCTGVENGWLAQRVDTHELQMCANGALYKIPGS
jgi:hypothetical protein